MFKPTLASTVCIQELFCKGREENYDEEEGLDEEEVEEERKKKEKKALASYPIQ